MPYRLPLGCQAHFCKFFRLERQEGKVREEAATTAASYEAQLSVMSEHLARCNITLRVMYNYVQSGSKFDYISA